MFCEHTVCFVRIRQFAKNLRTTYNDDAAGENALDNTVQLLSPPVNVSSYTGLTLSFEYAIQDYIGSGYFTAEVFNGTTWVEILNISVDTNPTLFTLDVTQYANPLFQVRFTYGDDSDWGWGAGVDNFSLTGTLGTNENTLEAVKQKVHELMNGKALFNY